ncbi:cell wall hydrolase [Sphingomonas sabuli]|uniref:Cell wall hydrolase n=2 Tax=Sphingomonas sabuli TaxID=2764186 RepID=A0A7G9L0F8_9SPHN|nr:cell wall hydrolase [Sphingomonas sabuli]
MVVSLRSALLVCAAMSAGSVAPAQVGPDTDALLPAQTAVTSTDLAKQLLRESDQVAVPTVATTPVAEPAVAEPAAEEAGPSLDAKADLSTLVSQLRGTEPGSRQLECLAAGIYFESKGEPLAGQLAVGEVIANRAGSGRFPSSYCGVLLQRGQFSFVRGNSWPSISKGSAAWKTAVAIAKIVDRDLKDSGAATALFFHAKRVTPGWRKKRVASIGNHVFYR